MKYFKRLLLRLLKPSAPRGFKASQLGAHTLHDIGIDPMAAEHQRDALLWQKLAA